MNMNKVENSSNVVEWGYDPVTKEMRIRFKQGTLYTYPEVPQEIADGLAAAESKGPYIARSVVRAYKGTKVPEEKVAPPEAGDPGSPGEAHTTERRMIL